MARIKDLYPDFIGESTIEQTIVPADQQAVIDQTNNVPERTTTSAATSKGIIAAFVSLIAIMLLLQFA